jgi:hypothetical protein
MTNRNKLAEECGNRLNSKRMSQEHREVNKKFPLGAGYRTLAPALQQSDALSSELRVGNGISFRKNSAE